MLADVGFAKDNAGVGSLLHVGQDKVAVATGNTVGIVAATKRLVTLKWVAETGGDKAVLSTVGKTTDGRLVAAGCLATPENAQVRVIVARQHQPCFTTHANLITLGRR